MKFSRDNGEVKVMLEIDPAQQLCLQVQDRGIGIRAEALPHLFREFRQLDSDIARRYPGTGLGLALIKKMLELHRGAIRVESEFG